MPTVNYTWETLCDKGEDIIILRFFCCLLQATLILKIYFIRKIQKRKKKGKKKITSTPEPFLAKTTALSGNGKMLLEKWLNTLANM